MPPAPSILVVEDDAHAAAALRRAFSAADPRARVEIVSDARGASLLLDAAAPEMLVLSLDLAGCSALKLLRRLSRRGLGSLFVVVLAADCADPRIREAMSLGASEALQRPVRPAHLASLLLCLTHYWSVLPGASASTLSSAARALPL